MRDIGDSPAGLRSPSESSVVEWLRARGVTEPRIADAIAGNQLYLLVTGYGLSPEEPRYTVTRLCELTGLDRDYFLQLWMSFGFPKVDPEAVLLTDSDLEAFTTLVGLSALAGMSPGEAITLSRVLGSAARQVAEAGLSSRHVAAAGIDDINRAEHFLVTADAVIPSLERLIGYVWRRHLHATAVRALTWDIGPDPSDPTVELSVGFADLAGFTALSQQLSGSALERLTSHFATVSRAVVHAHGGRVVKMIGDEVMFVAEDPNAAVQIGTELVRAARRDQLLSDVKVGIATGAVIATEGDYYGPAVNLASRIVAITRVASVVVTDQVRDRTAGTDRPKWKNLGRVYLHDIGWIRLWAARPARAGRRNVGAWLRERGPLAVLEEWKRQWLEQIAAVRGPIG